MADEQMAFRAPVEFLNSVKDEAKKAGMSASEYVRQSLEASMMWNWVGRQKPVTVEVAKPGVRQLGMRVIMPRGGCLHPPTAHEQRTFDVVCGLCGTVLRRL